MRGDKKAEGGKLAFILARGIGKAFVSREVDETACAACSTTPSPPDADGTRPRISTCRC